MAQQAALKIALLGAESTGKTQLSQELAGHLRSKGVTVTVIPEVLREWCTREGRTPRPEEQLPIAQEQERRADEAAATSQVVIADTTALMVAIYSAMLFEDDTLYQFAIERQRSYHVTLLTGLDLPWIADGLQRDGPHVREPVDTLVREALARHGIAYRIVYGQGLERLANTLSAIASSAPQLALRPAALSGESPVRWAWNCEKCGDPECEHRLFSGLLRDRDSR
jgi:nicotinamide riboside kinase